MSIIDKNSIKIQPGSIHSKKYWKYQVNVHKTNFEICNTIIQNNKENYIASNIAQMNTNTVETSDGIVTDDMEIDESEENEAYINDNSYQKSENMDHHVSDSDSINYEPNNLNGKINQNNTHEPISIQKLENDSLSDCSLGSCEKNEIDVEEEFKENTAPVNMESSYKQTDDNVPFSTQKLPNKDKTDNSIHKSINNIELEKINTTSSQENNITSKINLTNSSLQEIDNVSQTDQPLSNIDNTNSSIDQSINNINSQNIKTTSSHEDNITTENNATNFHPQNSDIVTQTTQELPNVGLTDIPIQKLSNNIDDDNNKMNELNEVQQGISNNDLIQDNIVATNQQSNTNNELSSLEKSNLTKENKTSILDEDNLQNYMNTSVINEISEQSNVNDNSEDKVTILSNDHEDSRSHNILEEKLPNLKSTISNINSVNSNVTDSSSLKEIKNETEVVASTDFQKTDVGKVDVIEGLNQRSIDQCTTESGCLNSMESIPKYDYDSVQYKSDNKGLSYTLHKPLEHNNDKPNRLEPKSFISSFSHPDACSGVNCLNFNKNIEKKIKSSQPLIVMSKPMNTDTTSHSTNIDFEKDNQNEIKQISEESNIELSLLDHFHNWISFPTLNSIDFLWTIFNEYSSAYYYCK